MLDSILFEYFENAKLFAIGFFLVNLKSIWSFLLLYDLETNTWKIYGLKIFITINIIIGLFLVLLSLALYRRFLVLFLLISYVLLDLLA